MRPCFRTVHDDIKNKTLLRQWYHHVLIFLYVQCSLSLIHKKTDALSSSIIHVNIKNLWNFSFLGFLVKFKSYYNQSISADILTFNIPFYIITIQRNILLLIIHVLMYYMDPLKSEEQGSSLAFNQNVASYSCSWNQHTFPAKKSCNVLMVSTCSMFSCWMNPFDLCVL